MPNYDEKKVDEASAANRESAADIAIGYGSHFQ
jgi:hypothetical protein